MLSLLLKRTARRWRQLVVLIAPFILLPLIIIGTSESKCAYVVLLVTIYWVTSALPLAVTSLLPIVLLPLFGILPSSKVGENYMKESNVMMLAGVTAAIAIENCDLHRRIALRILLLAGTTPKWLMLGFMCTTAFLSMWISNTAATSLMIPIVECILRELTSSLEEDENIQESLPMKQNGGSDNLGQNTVKIEVDESCTKVPETAIALHEPLKRRPSVIAAKMAHYRKGTLIAVAYASNFGGSTTSTGTGPNLVLMEYLNSIYKGAETGLTFATWMIFQIPCAIICLIFTWLWLQIVFFGPRSFCIKTSKESSKRVKNAIKRQYKEMGAMNFHQAIILTLFIILILLWFFRRPEFIPGWSSYLPSHFIKDSVAGIGIVFLMFAVPSKLDFLCCECSEIDPPPRALTWTVVQKKLPWGILLLMGGGYALADGSKASGLSKWVGDSLTGLSTLPPIAIMAILSIAASFITEVASNAAAAIIILPVLGNISESILVHPIYLMLPATLACSFAFILPVSTPPNALIFEVCGLTTSDMIKPGFVTKFVSLAFLILLTHTYGVYLFNLTDYPTWAMEKVIVNSTCVA